jgi:hypothetical protein
LSHSASPLLSFLMLVTRVLFPFFLFSPATDLSILLNLNEPTFVLAAFSIFAHYYIINFCSYVY